MANSKTACKDFTNKIISICKNEGVENLTLEKVGWKTIVKPILDDNYQTPKSTDIYKLMINLEKALNEAVPNKKKKRGLEKVSKNYVLDMIDRTEKISAALENIWNHSKTWLRFGAIRGAFNGVGTPTLWKNAHDAVIKGLNQSKEKWKKTEEKRQQEEKKEQQEQQEKISTDASSISRSVSAPATLETAVPPVPPPPPPPPMPVAKILTRIEELLNKSKKIALTSTEISEIENEAKKKVAEYFSIIPKGANEKKKINIAWMKKYVSKYYLKECSYPKEDEYFYIFLNSFNNTKKLVFESYNLWYNHIKKDGTKDTLRVYAAIKVTKVAEKLSENEQKILDTEFKLRSDFLNSLQTQISGGKKIFENLGKSKKTSASEVKPVDSNEEAIKKSNLPPIIKESLINTNWIADKEKVKKSWFGNLQSFISAEENRQNNEKTLQQIKENKLKKIDEDIEKLDKEIEQLGREEKDTEKKKKIREKTNLLALQKRLTGKYEQAKKYFEKNKPILSEENLKIFSNAWRKVGTSIMSTKSLPSIKEIEIAYAVTKNTVKSDSILKEIFESPSPEIEILA